MLTRTVQACAGLSAIFGLSALTGWTTDLRWLTSFSTHSIPMAPSTAVLFFIYGLLLALHAGQASYRRSTPVRRALLLIAFLASLLLLVLSSRGVHSDREHLGLPIGGRINDAPVGHISPVTAFCFMLIGLSLLLLSTAQVRRPWRAAAAFASSSLVLCIAVVLGVAYLLGGPLLYGSGVIPPALSTTLAFLFLSFALVVHSGLHAWPDEYHTGGAHTGYWLALAFGVVGVAILTTSYVYFQTYQQNLRAEVEASLSAIAEVKVSQLIQWRRERMGDAELFFDNEHFSSRVKSFLDNPAQPQTRARVQTWLHKIRTAYAYDRVSLLDAHGVERLASPDPPQPAEPHLVRDSAEVLASRQIQFLDFHRDESTGDIHLAVLVPILDASNQAPLGMLCLRIDPAEYLYPMLRRWPTPSRSAETLLVRRDGNDALVLSDLRFRADAALSLRLPLDRGKIPAVQAVLGHAGVLDGIDYRGVPVVAAVQPVPDSPWFLVARMDAAELFAPARQRLRIMVGLVAALLLGAAACVAFLWRHQRAAAYRQLYLAAEALRASERRYHTTLDGMLEGFQILGRDWRYLYVNDAAASHGRRPKDELLGKTLMECFPGIENTPLFEDLARCMNHGVPVRRENLFDYPDGSSAWFVLSIQPAPEGVAIVSLDITDRKEAEKTRESLEEQLRQSQKMEAVGRLAGGVAHDFNNMLQTILGYAEIILAELPPDHPVRDDVQQIQNAAERSSELTGQLLAFARKQTIAPRVLDLNDTVSGALKMLRRLIGEDIHLLWKPAPDLAPVKMDPAQIHQILANLVVNARDAIPGVGKITIETGAVQFDDAYCRTHAGFQPGSYLLLAVSDDGAGMDRDTRAHIFEPFFTTKPHGKGTGLGLATVYGIVKQNGGFINVYSEPGKGSTFRIYLLPQPAAPVAAVSPPPPAELPRGSETVLLVEDEATLLKLSRMMLERLGYTVLAAAGAREALELAHRHAAGIQLLMTDVVMPEMSGRDLWQHLADLHPGLPCLFMSGYTANVIPHHGVLQEGVHFLQKPFSLDALASKLRETLGN
ncbi:response regulator [bacterium]|nr:response regulator [bacterium]